MTNALHDAAADPINGLEKVKRLIEDDKVDVNVKHSKSGTRAIEFAAQSGDLITLQYLIEEAGADVDASKSTANLLEWCLNNTEDVIEYITDPENQLIKKFNDGTTDLHVAALRGQVEEIKTLLTENPARITEQNIRGRNVLFSAAFAENQAAVCAIISHKAFEIYGTSPDRYDPMLRGTAYRATTLGGNYGVYKIATYKQTISCLEQISAKNDYDYSLLVLHNICLGEIYFLEDKFPEAITAEQKALSYCEKIINDPQNKRRLTRTAQDLIKSTQLREGLIKESRLWGYKCFNIEGDGNCFYAAVAHQMGNGVDPAELRDQALTHIKNNIDVYAGFIEGDPCEYLEKKQQKDTQADHIDIVAVSRQFNVTLVFIRSDGTDPQIIKRPKPEKTLYLGYEVGFHYQSVVRKNYLAPTKFIAAKIEAAEIDTFESADLKRNSEDAAGNAHKKLKLQEEEYINYGYSTHPFFVKKTSLDGNDANDDLDSTKSISNN